MHRLILTETGAVVDAQHQRSIQDWVRTRAAEGGAEIRIDLAQVRSPNSDVLVALSLAARQAADLRLPVVLVNVSEQMRLALSQLGLADLGLALGADDPPRPTSGRHRPSTASLRPLVLVVDDDPINRRVAVLMLAKMGCESCQAAHGMEAIEICRSRTVDVVLMDVSMPIMDGNMATRHIRAAERLNGRHVPIIGLSAHSLEEDHRDGLAAGMDDYLGKPVDAAKLSRALGRWLAGRIREMVEEDDVVG